MSYLFWTFVHLVGVFGFQYTGILWFLAPALLHISISMFIFILGVSAALTPNLEAETVEEKPTKEFGNRFLMQLATIVTAIQLFNIGYPFFAGMAVLQGSTLALSVFFQKLFDKKE